MISARARPLARSTRYEAGHAQEVNTRERISFSLNRRLGYRRSRKADMRAYQEAGCNGAYQEAGYASESWIWPRGRIQKPDAERRAFLNALLPFTLKGAKASRY